MKTTTFYFVRHGETDYNLQGIVQGRGVDIGLNVTGLSQAAALAVRLSDVPFDAIYASTLLRARQTASIVAENHRDIPIQHLADLEEMAWGIYEGRPLDSLQQALGDLYQRWRKGDFGYRIEGGESIFDVQFRGRRAVESLMEKHAGETVLVVTHGRFLRVLLASLLKEYGLYRMHDIKHANTAVNQLTWQNGQFQADLLNCVAHLEGMGENE